MFDLLFKTQTARFINNNNGFVAVVLMYLKGILLTQDQ